MENQQPAQSEGAEFKVPTLDDEDTGLETGKKKKKNRFSQFLSKFLRPETESPPEGTTKRFLDSFKGIFGISSGVERHEIPERQEESDEGNEHTSPLRMPFFSGLPEAQLATANSGEVDDNQPIDVDDTEVITQPHLLEQSGSVTEVQGVPFYYERSDIAPEDPRVTEFPEQETTDHQYDVIDRSEPVEVADRSTAEPGFSENREVADSLQQRETIIEKRGGAGAALAGLVAAETLSRHRDKKISKEADKLKKRVKAVENKQSIDGQEIALIKEKNRLQAEELARRRVEAKVVAEKQKAFVSQYEAPVMPILRTVEGRPETAQQQSRATVEHQGYQVQSAETTKEFRTESIRQNAETIRELRREDSRQEIETTKITEELVRNQVEMAAEQDVAIEAYYERMHEAKDEPTGGTAQAGGAGAFQARTTSAMQQQQQLVRELEQEYQAVQNSRQLYSQAAKQGLRAGIAVVVAFVVVALVWSLV